MLGLSFEKLLVVALIVGLIIGPDRLPLYAGRLAKFVRSLRGRSEAATARVKQELGDGFDIIEWKQLDPRQYDPRRIIREALTEVDEPAPQPAMPAPQPESAPTATTVPAQPETSIARLMRTSLNRVAAPEQPEPQESATESVNAP